MLTNLLYAISIIVTVSAFVSFLSGAWAEAGILVVFLLAIQWINSKFFRTEPPEE